MRIVRIPKRSGGWRTIHVPSDAEQGVYRAHLNCLHEIQERLLPDHVAHGFVRWRSPVSNAWWHRGYRFTLSLDLSDWFDSVTPWHVGHTELGARKTPMQRKTVCEFWERQLFYNGIAAQGLATSPLVANIAASPMDWEVVSQRRGWIYTRYADDLTVSADSMDAIAHAERVIREAVARRRWRIADHKRRIQCADHGRRIVTGVGVDAKVHPTRLMKRRLRAARHQRNKHHADGLAGWVLYCDAPPEAYLTELGKAGVAFDTFAEELADGFGL